MDVTANLAAAKEINEEGEWRGFSVDNAFLHHFGKSFVKRHSAFWLAKS